MTTPTYIDRSTERVSLFGTLRDLYQYRALLRNLVTKDLALKYRGSTLGFFWSLIHPLIQVVVYTFAFTYILSQRSELFVFRLLVGLLTWQFFAMSANMAAGAIVDNVSLTKSLRFPRAILPLSSVLFNFVQFLLTMSVFLPLMYVFYRQTPSIAIVLFPPLLALQIVFIAGVAFLMAALTALFRDVRHLLEVALMALFWATPILYPIDAVPAGFRPVIEHLPLAPFIIGFRAIFVSGVAPSVQVWLTAGAYAAGALFVGSRVFFALEHRFAESM